VQFVGLLIFSNKLTLPVYFPNFSNFKRFSVHSHIALRPSSQIGYAPDKSSQTDQIGRRLLKGKHLSMISNFLKAIIWISGDSDDFFIQAKATLYFYRICTYIYNSRLRALRHLLGNLPSNYAQLMPAICKLSNNANNTF